jgi:DNA-binding NtrC family response regulator
MKIDHPSPGRVLLIGDRRYVVDVALDIARARSSTLSVSDVDRELFHRLGLEGASLLTVELSVPDVKHERPAQAANDQAANDQPGDHASMIAPFVGSNIADVERALILGTLTHCHGNRTSAANILGISVRTMRNKLRLFMDEGMLVPPPPVPGSSAAAPRRSL